MMDIKQGKRSRYSFFGLGFNVEDFGVGFERDILLKGMCELGFEERKE